MTFCVYSGALASNASINITKHGSFEAESEVVARAIIDFNVKYRYCEEWQIANKDKSVPCIREALKWGAFVCKGEPVTRNLVWKADKAVIIFFS